MGEKENDRGSEVVVRDGYIYVAGQVAEDGSSTVAAQTRTILARIDALLASAGGDRSMVSSATIYLSDAGGFEEMDTVWSEWVPDESPVVRITVESRLAAAGSLVEIGISALVSPER